MRIKEIVNNNKGLSLVELIVAISIGVIVSGTIAALMTFAIRMYRNESVNTSLQYELQTNINMMMDAIMGSSTIVVVQNDSGEPHTKYVMLGNPQVRVKDGDDNLVPGFKGVIFVPGSPVDGKFRIYMKNVEEPMSGTVEDVAEDQIDNYFSAPDADMTEYLLGENATQFEIICDPRSRSLETVTKTDYEGKTVNEYYYNNPIEVGVKLKFERDGWAGKKYEKQVDDVAYMRNRIRGTIYVDGNPYKLRKSED